MIKRKASLKKKIRDLRFQNAILKVKLSAIQDKFNFTSEVLDAVVESKTTYEPRVNVERAARVAYEAYSKTIRFDGEMADPKIKFDNLTNECQNEFRAFVSYFFERLNK